MERRARTGWAIVAALVAATASARLAAAEPVRISVVDERDAPVPLADVALSGDGVEAAMLTDKDGIAFLELPDSTEGPLRVEISAAGKQPRSLTLDEIAAAGSRVVLTDDEVANSGIDILVQGRRISSAYTPQSIGKLQILTDPLARADALLAVANLPGSTNADSSADIQLRGSAVALSRAYFNDIPLYEVVRGSSVDRATPGFSVFNSSVIQEVETYPTNPPLFLANASGGAVRILPDDASSGSSTFYASLAGAGLTRSIPLGGTGGQVQLYTSVTELEPLLALNPKLRDVTTSFRSLAVGASTRLRLGPDTRIGLLNVLDAERGRYPFRYFGRVGENRSDRIRSYNLLTVEQGIGNVRVKMDASYTESRGRQTVGTYRSRTRNDYSYLAADVAGSAGFVAAEYRVGLASESIHLRNAGDIVFSTPQAVAVQTAGSVEHETADTTAAYAYLSIRPMTGVTLAAATRQPLWDRPEQGASYQATATLKTGDGTHRFILGAGRYTSVALPESLAFGRIEPAASEQVSLDYKLELPKLRGAFGVYAKQDRIGATRTRVRGVDAYLSADLGDTVNIWGSFTTAKPIERSGDLRYRAGNYLSYLVRLGLRVEVSPTTAVSFAFVGRNGTPYTGVIGRTDILNSGTALPVFAPVPNQLELRPYRTVDLNLTNIMTWWPGSLKPIGFVSASNVLDRRNPSRVDYDLDSLRTFESFYQRRAVTVGLVFQL